MNKTSSDKVFTLRPIRPLKYVGHIAITEYGFVIQRTKIEKYGKALTDLIRRSRPQVIVPNPYFEKKDGK
ncbi:hypothetical protein CRE_16701 [Caenorhabditis remanei]|uniref:Uncharacterized protein n=1 Tax=Caenorhabditis remanei TaxID=31234 RepID=E3MB51_CAERE|nr:hypothetical protein CRE_16701 [Caenorhabditis remanei]